MDESGNLKVEYCEIDREEGLQGQRALLDALSDRFKVKVDDLKTLDWIGPDYVPGTVSSFCYFLF